MRMTRYFLPLLKETPGEARIASHRLMLRAGMIRQAGAGIYSWLPLGLRVLKKIEAIVRDEQERAGAVEILMPTLQPAALWKRSGRYGDYGEEMLKISDRQGRELVYGPTNEELVTEIMAGSASSWRDAGRILFHIQWKFRDEIRPRFGVMRGREFLMKDGYSFDIDLEAAQRSYRKMFVSYLRSFARMGLKAIPVAADPGPIGGEMSHEFVIPAPTGESELWFDRRLLDLEPPADPDYQSGLSDEVGRWTQFYAAESGRHDPARFEAVPAEHRMTARGIEAGHIFFFGDKYAKPLGAEIVNAEGRKVPFQCGSYGIGISRLAGGIIEASHDARGIVWPEPVAPFRTGLINAAPADKTASAACEEVYGKLMQAGIETLYDDSQERAGAKFAGMDLIGLPWQIIIGSRSAKAGRVELKRRRAAKDGQAPEPAQEMDCAAAIQRLGG